MPAYNVEQYSNNPFNMRPPKEETKDKWLGAIGVLKGYQNGKDINYFLVFDTIQHGVRAGIKLLKGKAYINGSPPLNTVSLIIPKYAPASDGNQPFSYINNVVTYIRAHANIPNASSFTKDTIITFDKHNETNPVNLEIFRTLITAMISTTEDPKHYPDPNLKIASTLATIDLNIA